MTEQLYLADGRPIPYVAAWSNERQDILAPEPLCENHLAVFTSGGRGEGRPLLGEMDPARQRQCMELRRCQVCFRPLTRLWMAELIEGSAVIGGVRRLPVLREPAACARCLRLALEACPHLRKVKPAVLEVQELILIATLCRPTGPLEGDPRVPPSGVISYVKAAPAKFRRVSNEEFRRR